MNNSNPNLEGLETDLCDNKVVDSLRIPLCNPSWNAEDESTNDNDDDNDDKGKEEEKKHLERQEQWKGHNAKKQQQQQEQQIQEEHQEKQQEEDDKAKKQQKRHEEQQEQQEQQQQQQEQQEQEEQQEEDKAKEQNNNNNDDEGNVEQKLGIAGLDLDIDKKLTDANEKIQNLRDKINREDNQYAWEQQEGNKQNNKNGKNENNNDENSGIAGLDLKIQKIETSLEKKIEKLKDKIENDKDNQRLILQREESETRDDDDDDDDDDYNDDNDDNNDNSGETHEGYRFIGDKNDGNNDDDKNFNFATAGDFSCSANTEKMVANIGKKDPELVLALGDLSQHSTADCWFDLMSPFKGKMMMTFGYHDVKDGILKLNQYKAAFGLDKLYYSFDYKGVHFIVMSTLSEFDVNSDQYKFIEKDLKAASENENIDWVVVTNYGPFYTSPSTHPAKNDIRNIYHPLFDRYGVDLVLNGHNHNYQRTYPLTFNIDKTSKPTITNTFTTGYNGNNDGIVYAIVGTAGEGFHPLQGRESYMATQFEGRFGFLNIEISNGNPHTKLTATFYDNKGSNVLDEFTIEKEIKNMKSEVKYIGADTKATNVIPIKGNNTDNMPQQTNGDIDIKASNILPVKNNISNTGTYKILPSYSELNEK
jgi:hypothetical protein